MGEGRAIRRSRIAAAILLAAAAAGILPGAGIVPCAGYDRFPGTRMSPDVLIVLNRGASMSAPAGDAVSDLDGNGTRSRHDLALSVLFRLLNANGNRIEGLASPRNAADVSRFRRLIDIEDELFLHARIGVLPYGDGAQPKPLERPPSGERTYREMWDFAFALGKSRSLSPHGPAARFPAEDIASHFARAASHGKPDPLAPCRPRVVILITDGSDLAGSVRLGGLPDGIERLYPLFVGVSGEEERTRLRRLLEGANGSLQDPDGWAGTAIRVAFFESPEEVDASDIFEDIAAPFDLGPWKTADPVVPARREPDSNRLFAASLSAGKGGNPMPETGSLRSHILGPDGSPPDAAERMWDAVSSLAAVPPAARRIYTSVGGARKNVAVDPSSGVDPSLSGVSRTSEAAGIVDDVRNRPLGGLSVSTPVLVGPPSPYYADAADPAARQAFAGQHSRRKRVLLAGGNDGMLHAFDAGAWDPRQETAGYGRGTGEEEWAYFPGFLLGKRKDPSLFSGRHAGSAEGSTAVADIVVGNPSGPTHPVRETGWRTYAIGGAGTGERGYFALDITDPRSIDYPAPKWELSKDDMPLLGRAWSTPAIGRVRVTTSEGVGRSVTRGRWVAVVGAGKGTPSGATTLRESVDLRTREADPGVVRVESTGNAPDSGQITLFLARLEKRKGKWVSVRYKATGSYSSKEETAFRNVAFRNRPDRIEYAPAGTVVSWTDPGDEGKAILVLDAARGEVLQALTHPDMGEVVAPPAIVIDSEGYIERVYVGDLAGNVWRATADPIGNFDLGGKPFFSFTGDGYSREIYAKAAVAGGEGTFPGSWIFFGTGNRENPMDGSRGAMVAVYDDLPAASPARTGTVTLTERNLADATGFFDRIGKSDASFSFPVKGAKGWYGTMPGSAEKILSAPRVFHHNLFFATFDPTHGTCPPGGTGRIYGFGIVPGRNMGSPALEEEDRPEPMVTGAKSARVKEFPSEGILSGPVISVGSNGTAMLYTGSPDGTVFGLRIPAPASNRSIRYWRDVSR